VQYCLKPSVESQVTEGGFTFYPICLFVCSVCFGRRPSAVSDVSNEREHGDAVVRGPVELLDHTLLVGGTS